MSDNNAAKLKVPLPKCKKSLMGETERGILISWEVSNNKIVFVENVFRPNDTTRHIPTIGQKIGD